MSDSQPRGTGQPQTADPPPRRRRRWRRIVPWLTIGAVAMVILLAVLLWYAILTEGGARLLFRHLDLVLPGELEAEELKGTAWGPLEIRGFSWQNERVRIFVDHLTFEWRLHRLFLREVDVRDLHARGVRVWIKPAPEPVDELRDLDLGYSIWLHRALIEDLQIFRPDAEEPVVIDRLELDTAELGDFLQVTRFEIWSPHIDAEVAGRVRPRGDYDVNLEVSWALRLPDLPELEGRGTVSGTLVELEIRQRLSQPFSSEVRGTLFELFRNLRFALDTTFEGLDPQLFNPDAPAMVVRGGAQLEGRSLQGFRSRGRVSAITRDWGPIDADFRFERDGDSWRFERVELQRPRTLTLAVVEGTYLNVSPGTFEGVVRWQDMSWPLDREPIWRSPEARIQVSGNVDRYTLRGDARLATEALPMGHYVFTAQGGRASLDVQQITGRVLDGTVRGSGRVRWDPALAYRVDLVADNLDLGPIWPQLPPEVGRARRWEVVAQGTAGELTADPLRVDLLEGTVRGRATLQWDPVFAWTFAGTAEEIDPARIWPRVPAELAPGTFWSLDLAGSDAAMTVRSVRGRALGGAITARGEVGWEPRVRWDLELVADGVHPQVLWPEWPGELHLVGSSAGVVVPEGLLGTLTLDRARGTLRGRPLVAEADLGFRGEHWDLRRFEATWGPAHLLASGDLGQVLDLEWRLVSLELEALLPDAGGRLEAAGRLTGPRAAPRLAATFDGLDLAYRDLLAHTVSGTLDLGLAEGGPFEIDLEARELFANGRRADFLVLRGRGSREDHWLTAVLTAPEGGMELALQGGLTQATWRGRALALRLESERMGVWDLETPVPLVAATDRLGVGHFCWVSGEAHLCGSGSWVRGGPLEVLATLDQLPLTLLEPWAPTELRLEGTVDGNVALGTDAVGRLVGELELRPGAGTTLAPWGRPEAGLTLIEGDLLVRAFPEGIQGDIHLLFEEDAEIGGSFVLPDYVLGRGLADQTMIAELRGHFTAIGFLEGLVPFLTEPRGRIELALDVAGTVGDPIYSGTARLEEGRARVPRYGLDLEEIELVARGDGAGPLQIEGSLRSGEGTLELLGETYLLVAPSRPLRLALQGSGVEILDNEMGRVVADPDLELAYDREQLQLTGTVQIPEARLTHREAAPEAVAQSLDVVYVTEEPDVVAPPGLQLWAQVRVVLGEDVRFETRGLETRVVGSLLLLEAPGRPTRAIGELESLDGTLALYGRILEITHGRLVFAGGPVTEPTVALRASRTARDAVVAGIDVRGTLQQPRVTLWSDPAMSESEVLSYLVLGRPWATDTEPDILGRATTTLGLQAGQLIAQHLGARLGLEEVAIVTDDALEEAMLVLGAYLSPRLFVAYGIGLFDPVSTFRIRYLIDHNWTVQAETGGVRTGGDLLYTVERGGPEPAMRLSRPERIEELEALPIPAPREAPEGGPPTRDDGEDEEEEDGEGQEEAAAGGR